VSLSLYRIPPNLLIVTLITGFVYALSLLVYNRLAKPLTDMDKLLGLNVNPSLAALSLIVFILLTPIIYALQWIVRSTISRFSGSDRLQSILVGWGILLFILGNLLQFLSTF
jgi:hypothetical protein